MNEGAMLLGLIASAMGVCGTIIGAAWYLSSRVSSLAGSADGLTKSVRSLERAVEKLDDKLDSHADRITRIEAQQGTA